MSRKEEEIESLLELEDYKKCFELLSKHIKKYNIILDEKGLKLFQQLQEKLK